VRDGLAQNGFGFDLTVAEFEHRSSKPLTGVGVELVERFVVG
jgi:hypothetical protein